MTVTESRTGRQVTEYKVKQGEARTAHSRPLQLRPAVHEQLDDSGTFFVFVKVLLIWPSKQVEARRYVASTASVLQCSSCTAARLIFGTASDR